MVRCNFSVAVLTTINILLMSSCTSLGKIDEHGRYVPKHSNYSFKDKKGHIKPINLDIENIYKLNYKAYKQREIYPFNEDKNELRKTMSYIKFYPEGRCLRFGIPTRSPKGNENNLSSENLDPHKQGGPARSYYFSKDVKKITTEGFYPGDGGGIYLLFTYHLSATGDTLTRVDGNYYEIYVKEILPDSLKRDYEIDW